MGKKIVPNVGERFGNLYFVAVSDEKRCGEIIWIMTCSCGKTGSFIGSNVRRGNTTSCCGNAKRQDLVGKRFDRLVVVEKRRDKNNRVQWLCRCDCGGETVTYTTSLNTGHTKSCGCLHKEVLLDTSFIDITGQKFGLLTALDRVHEGSGDGAHWVCRCDCGNNKVVMGSKLRQGVVVSCGCVVGAGKRVRPDKIADKYSAHAQNRRARIVGAGGSFTSDQVENLFKLQRGKCAWCGVKLKRYHKDHRKSLHRGGKNDIKNIELLCGPCNLKKSAKDEIAWANENGKLC